MKTIAKVLHVALVAGALVMATGAHANKADDKKWIDQCVKDNKAEGAKAEVVKKYCTCMNEKMDDNETRSITQWEKANPKAMKECEKASGWK
jgi:hypothetical protein